MVYLLRSDEMTQSLVQANTRLLEVGKIQERAPERPNDPCKAIQRTGSVLLISHTKAQGSLPLIFQLTNKLPIRVETGATF